MKGLLAIAFLRRGLASPGGRGETVRSAMLAIAAFGLGAAGAACAGDTKTVERPAVERGESLAGDPGFSSSSVNYLACDDCHSRTTDEGDRIFPAYPLENSAGRESWWGGYAAQYLGAVDFCNRVFMRGQPIVAGQEKGDALYEYLFSISPQASSPALPVTITRNIPLIPGGDAVAGEAIYDVACRHCHGSPSGSGRLDPSVTALNGDLWALYDVDFPGIDHRVVVAEKVRHGSFFGIGGVMPFFSEERLTDAELASVMAYLGL